MRGPADDVAVSLAAIPCCRSRHASSIGLFAIRRMRWGSVSLGGVKLPLALAELGLIDEYEFVVQPG